MNVKELIEKLKKEDPNRNVIVNAREGYDDIIFLKEIDVKLSYYTDWQDGEYNDFTSNNKEKQIKALLLSSL